MIIDGVSYIVKEMHLLATTLEGDDGGEIYAPNNLLAEGMIQNLRRSGPMSEKIQIQVSFDTDFEQIETLRERLLEFVQSEARDFFPRLDLIVVDMDECNKMVLEVEIQYKVNLQDDGRRAMRKNKVCISGAGGRAERNIGHIYFLMAMPIVVHLLNITHISTHFPNSPTKSTTITVYDSP